MKISAFVDTNIFYDYPNLDQIKWLEVLKADHVLIVLPPVIFRELNDHKDSGRKPHLAGRAASTLLNLDRFFDSHPDDNTVPVRDGVDLFGDCQDAPVNPPLNPLIGDDPLIANILMYQTNHPDERVVLITDDRGLKLKARGCGVTCVKLPIEYKTIAPQDPRDKKIKAQDDLIEQLKKTPEPVLDITFANGEREICLEAIWMSASSAKSVLYGEIFKVRNEIAMWNGGNREEPPPGTMEIKFQLKSIGTKAAEKIVVFIDLPEGCLNWKPRNQLFNIGPPGKWYTGADAEDDHIQYSGPELVHGLVRDIGPVHVIFPEPKQTYEFKWTARAGNMREPSTGVLRIVPKPEPPPKTAEEKAREEQAAWHILKELLHKNKATDESI